VASSSIILPPNSTGAAIHTRNRTVAGPGSVHEQWVIPRSDRVASGVYIAHTGAHVISAAATTGTTTGFWWLYNPVGSTLLVAFRRAEYTSQMGTALVTPTSPRIQLKAFTFTGGPTGTVIAPRKADTTQVAATATLRSTQATATVTLAEDLFAFLPAWSQSSTSGGPGSATVMDWTPDEDGQTILRAGEGIVCYQPDAGTASDTRRFVTNIAWTEFVVP
jgi:hypothetical protein